MAETKRLDVAMTLRGLTASRSKAAALIQAGSVTVNGICCKKSSHPVGETDEIVLTDGERFVSRGGYKLLKAIDTFAIDLNGTVCMDVGASTGGFTDCMLQHGAAKVYSIDVGTDQLAAVLRNDPRVVCKEQCNFRYMTREDIEQTVGFASVDVSFISLDKILPTLYELLKNNANAKAVCLIKPQFEAGKEHLSKNGVVRSKAVHRQVITRVMQGSIALGFSILGLTFSPIKGPQGNVEYLLYLGMCQPLDLAQVSEQTIQSVVEHAHKELSDKE